MAVTNYIVCGTGSADGSGTVWTSPGNITRDDGLVAQAAFTAKTQYLVGTNFKLANGIPSKQIDVLGVEVQVEARVSAGAFSPARIAGIELRLNGSRFGSLKSPDQELAVSLTKYTFGGSNDLWGNSEITYSQVTNSNFGVAWFGQTDFSDLETYQCDYVSMRVYWTTKSGVMRGNIRPWRGRV